MTSELDLRARPEVCDVLDRVVALQRLRARLFASSVPIRLGRYELRELLGRGSGGAVFRARDRRLHRDVAIKLLPARSGPDTRTDAGIQEAITLARVEHANVIAVHDVGVYRSEDLLGAVEGAHGVGLYLVMELATGTTLRRWLEDAPRSTGEIERAFVEAGRGLAAIHAAGLVHGDFKADNVVIAADGRVKVLDLGLAGVADAGWARPVGTLAYLAPERYLGAPADARSDQFAYCMALYEALTDSPPSSAGDHETARVDLHRRLGALRWNASRRVPRRVQQVVARGLAVDPAARFESMEQVLAGLAARRGPTRRSIVVAVAASIALASFAGSTAAGLEDPLSCRTDASALRDRVWSDERRAGIPAEHETQLATYAEQYVAARDTVCVKHDDPLLATRIACLERVRTSLDVVAKHLAMGADARALDALPPVRECLVGAPSSGWEEDANDSHFRERREIDVLLRVGRFAEVLDRAGQALAGAELPPARRAWWLRMQGAALAQSGDHEGARAALEQAWLRYEEAGSDEGVVRSLLYLAGIERVADDADAARRYEELARARASARPRSAALLAEVEQRSGIAALNDDPAAALRHFEAAYAHARTFEPEGGQSIRLAHHGAALALHRLGRLEQAHRAYHEGLRDERCEGDASLLCAEQIAYLARLHIDRGEPAIGLELLARAIALMERPPGGPEIVLERYLAWRAEAQLRLGHADAAASARAAVAHARAHGREDAQEGLYARALLLAIAGEDALDEARAVERAVARRPESERAEALHWLGHFHARRGDLPAAARVWRTSDAAPPERIVAVLERAWTLAASPGDDASIARAAVENPVVAVHEELARARHVRDSDPASALEHARVGLELWETLQVSDQQLRARLQVEELEARARLGGDSRGRAFEVLGELDAAHYGGPERKRVAALAGD